MPDPTDAEILSNAKLALNAILKGRVQDMSVEQKRMQMLQIRDLRELIKEYEPKVMDAESGAGGIALAVMQGAGDA